ncbi:MAG: 4-hydroxythreonine-4-phosphate dehydrogenase PdxA [Gammaproteobacteria bacterium]
MSSTASTNSTPPRIALTPGEPAGIGPDLAIALAQTKTAASVACFADPAVIAARARLLDVPLRIVELGSAADAKPQPPGVMQVVPVHTAAVVVPGKLDVRNAAYVLACLDGAMDACAAGMLDALVTGPLQKSIINDAGHRFSGHTEYLADRLGAPHPVMMLAAGELKVVLLTTHVPLVDVPKLITAARIDTVTHITARELSERFGLPDARLCLCGLNPHAGEQGHLGREEIDIIAPAIAALRASGLDVEGPLPADTAFTPEQRRRFDAIIAMYHDQGLAALKAVSFGNAVNITLGLPIIRTSVDHGTALDLAGTGRAEAGSLHSALHLAISLARQRHE